VLSAPDEAALRSLHSRALAEGLPCSLFVDENCRGVRSATVLGLGPLMIEDARLVTEELPLMK
jgi:peptidyl-tRNA hydrolase